MTVGDETVHYPRATRPRKRGEACEFSKEFNAGIPGSMMSAGTSIRHDCHRPPGAISLRTSLEKKSIRNRSYELHLKIWHQVERDHAPRQIESHDLKFVTRKKYRKTSLARRTLDFQVTRYRLALNGYVVSQSVCLEGNMVDPRIERGLEEMHQTLFARRTPHAVALRRRTSPRRHSGAGRRRAGRWPGRSPHRWHRLGVRQVV